jgi:hypothetical protein
MPVFTVVGLKNLIWFLKVQVLSGLLLNGGLRNLAQLYLQILPKVGNPY